MFNSQIMILTGEIVHGFNPGNDCIHAVSILQNYTNQVRSPGRAEPHPRFRGDMDENITMVGEKLVGLARGDNDEGEVLRMAALNALEVTLREYPSLKPKFGPEIQAISRGTTSPDIRFIADRALSNLGLGSGS